MDVISAVLTEVVTVTFAVLFVTVISGLGARLTGDGEDDAEGAGGASRTSGADGIDAIDGASLDESDRR